MTCAGWILGTYLWILVHTSSSMGKQLRRHSGIQGEPGFVGNTVKNVTVPEGRDVVLSCTVKNLEGHKVAWIHYDRSAILTVQNHVITRNPRIGVSHEGHRTWNLHIRNVERSDQGAYMCQINTAKAKTKLGYLTVVVPPRIEDSMSSGDKVRTEGSNVTLECTARGSPKPTVTWKREDGRNINIDKSRNFSVPFVEGETLRLYKVSRLDMGGYMCIAANGVPPAVSKLIHLGIDFPPMMWVPNQQLRSLLGGKVKLKCVVEAHPEALIFWEKNGSMLQSSERIKMRVLYGEPSYKVEMKLLITSVQKEDFGVFKCIAKNPRGVTDGMITLTEIPVTLQPQTSSPRTSTSSTSTTDLIINIIHEDNIPYKHSQETYGSYQEDGDLWNKDSRGRKNGYTTHQKEIGTSGSPSGRQHFFTGVSKGFLIYLLWRLTIHSLLY